MHDKFGKQSCQIQWVLVQTGFESTQMRPNLAHMRPKSTQTLRSSLQSWSNGSRCGRNQNRIGRIEAKVMDPGPNRKPHVLWIGPRLSREACCQGPTPIQRLGSNLELRPPLDNAPLCGWRPGRPPTAPRLRGVLGGRRHSTARGATRRCWLG